MRLTFVAKDPNSNPTNSPTLYRTDRGSWLVQGFVVTDPEALAEMDIPEGESVVEIPDRMIQFFTEEGDFLLCPTHGALYTPDTGECVSGPPCGKSLFPVQLVERGDDVLALCPDPLP